MTWGARQRRTALALGGITALALALRLWRLDRYGLWTDEVFTLHVALRPLGEVLLGRDQTPPLFAALLHVWTALLGSGDAAVRLLPALCGTAAVPILHQAARRWVSPRGALAVALLAALSVYFVILSQEARAFALLLLLSAASFLCFLRLQERWTRGRAIAYVVVGALLLYAHLYGAFFLAAQNLWLLAAAPRRWARPSWLGLQAAVALLFAPWLPVFAEASRRVAHGFWIQPPTPADAYWTAFVLAGSRLLIAALAALLVWGAALDARRRGQPAPAPSPAGDGAPSSLLWAWLAVPVLVPFVVSFAYPIFTPRYVVPAAAPLLILAVRAMEQGLAGRTRLAATAGLAALVVLQAVALGRFYVHPGEGSDSRQDWPGVVALVESHAAPNATLLFNKGYCDSASDRDLACAYERGAHRRDVRLVPFFFEDRGVSDPVDAGTVRALAPLVQGAGDVWVLYSYPSDTGRLIPRQLQELGYHPAGEWAFKRIDVLRFQK